MGGITSSVGLFSGINTQQIIDQLIAVESRPLALAQTRLIQLQAQNAAYLDINSRMDALRNLAASFRTENVFQNKSAASSDESVLTATASQNAPPGSYDFIVDRLVSTQQFLSRGFSNSDTSGVGIDSLTLEGVEARLDRETSLSDFNDGDGITRGTINVNGTEVDLSRAATVDDVLSAINEVAGVTAYADNDKLVIEGVTSIDNVGDAEVLESLGLDGAIVGDTLTGSSVYGINALTPLSAINDGRGLGVRTTSGENVFDITITLDETGDGFDGSDTEIQIRLGDIEAFVDGELTITDPAVSTIGGAIDRINAALADAGVDSEVSASIDPSTGGIAITDSSGRDIRVEDFTSSGSSSTAALDLGIAGDYSGGSAVGSRIFAGINTTLVSSLNGGSGLDGTDGLLDFTTRDGTNFVVDVSGLGDVNDIINAINNDATNDGRVVASINATGNGIELRDTSSGATTFEVAGTGGADAAAALGISGSFTSGRTDGANLQLAYIGTATRLDSINGGVGSGTFEIIDSNNLRVEVSIASTDVTLADVIRRINSSAAEVNARINDTGDGIIIEDTAGGGNEIEINDIEGAVAENLRFEGTASGTGADNFIDGSLETTLDIDSTSTLQEIVNEINAANAGASASIVNTGDGASPFRLSITADASGSEGRFIIDSGGFDLGLSVLDEGNDARVFFGSDDPAKGVLITSSTNQLDGVIQGVSLDLKSTSDTPVEISVSSDTSSAETKIQEFIDAFNETLDRIDFQTRFDEENEVRGPLLGDGTVNALRNSLFNAILRQNDGFSSEFNGLTQVGITVGDGAKLEFDAEAFREALAEDPQAVEDLFTRRVVDTDASDDDDPNTDDDLVFSSRGAMVLFEEFAERYANSFDGVLQNRTEAIESQMSLQEDRISRINERLNDRRVLLERQFLAMEQAIASFQSQGNALAQIAQIG
jgi:flagellar hook-associated protein 2